MTAPILILVLGDQLSHSLASLRDVDRANAVVLMVEVRAEGEYVKHHKQKIALIFSAMRHFAAELRAEGWTVDYTALDDPDNAHSFDGELARALARHGPASVRVTESGEHRTEAILRGWRDALPIPVHILPDDRFMVSRAEFEAWAKDRKRFLMEDFYRWVRKRTGILMDGRDPVGGAWNFDRDNRKRAPKGLKVPPRHHFPPDRVTREVMALVEASFPDHFGDLDSFQWPVTRADALAALGDFVTARLPGFGDYQDALVDGERTLFHALVSTSMNCGLLTPREVVDAALAAYAEGLAPLNAVEGFVRQIVGWREFVRGLYFHTGPEYMSRNFLGATRDLPAFYWTGGSGMRCMDDAVAATRENAYAHHIQRLMVLGNFAMLIGTDPVQVHEWYLTVYADAYEWVEAPNVIGMSQFADGGLMGSKPYAGGGAYIDRMSDHCGKCRYDVKRRSGAGACPFNALYWDFLARNRDRLGRNNRLLRMYDNWDGMSVERRNELRASAADFMGALPGGQRGWAIRGIEAVRS